jgi:hypothetical protein
MALVASNPVGDFTGTVNAINAQQWFKELGVTVVNDLASQNDISGMVVTPSSDGFYHFVIGAGADDGPSELTLNPSGQLAQSVIHGIDRTTTDNFDNSGQLQAKEIAYVGGGDANTAYSNDPNTSWYSQTDIEDADGNVIGSTVVNRDGTFSVTSVDAATGKQVTTLFDAHGNPTSQSIDPGITYPAFVTAIADTLATQLIAKFLTANNIPATILAQAFADATIKSALAPANVQVDFSQELASSAFNIAGGIAGSEVGSTIAQALGIPTEAGSLVGGTLGNLVTQAIVKDVFNIPGNDVLTISNLENSIAGSGGAYVGELLADALVGPTEAGQVIGSLATAVALSQASITAAGVEFADLLLFSDPALAPLAIFALAFGSEFVGNLIGSIFGSHPSVGPNASAVGQWNPTTHAFEFKVDYKDNGGDPAQVDAMIVALNGVMTNLVPTFGGTMVGPVPNMSLAWIQGHYYFQLGDHYATTYPFDNFSSPEATLEAAAVKWLASIRFAGADPRMVYAVQHTEAKTLAALISDLNAAKDYSAYLADPVAFDAGIAALGDPAKLALWQAELARVHQLGLDTLTTAQIADLNTYGTTTPVTFGIVGAYNEPSYAGWQFEFGLRNADGTAFTLPSHVLATTTNANGMGGYDFITSDNSALSNLRVVEVAKDGTLLSSGQLTLNGSPLTNSINANSTFLGVAQGLLGTAGKDLLFKGPNGIVQVFELDPATPGRVVQAKTLVSSTGQPLLNTLSSSGPDSVIGTGHNVLGRGGADLFVTAGGAIVVYEFDAQGNPGGGVSIATTPGHLLNVPQGVSIVGSGSSVSGAHDQALFLRFQDGHVEWREFNNGQMGQNTTNNTLTNPDGSTLLLEPGATIEVAGNNLTGNGGRDVLIRHVDQHVTVVEIDANGHTLATAQLLNTDNTAFAFTSNEAIVGTGANASGNGGHDLFIREPNGQISVREFDATGHSVFSQTFAANSINLADKAQATLTSSGNTIGLGANDTLTVSSAQINLTVANTTDAITGINNTINPSSGDTINLGNDSQATVTGSGNTINLGARDTVTASGDTINLTTTATTDAITGDNDRIISPTGLRQLNLNVSGTGDTITAYSSVDVITINTTHANVTLNGNSETLFAGDSNGTITLNGNAAGVLLNGNSETLNVHGLNSSATITGANDGVLVTGNYATVYENGTGGSLTLDGNYFGVALNGSGDTIYANGNGGNITVTGNGNGIVLNGSGDTVYLNGNQEILVINGTGNGVLVNGSYETVYINSSGNSVAFASGSHNNGVGGGGVVNVGSGQQTTVSSAGVTVNLAAQDNLTASNDLVYLTASSTTEAITGTGDTILSGPSLSYIGLTINGTNHWAVLGSSHDNITVNATNSSIEINGSYETASVLGAGDNVTINGSYDGVLANANSQTIYVDGAAASVTLAGNNSELFANANDTIYANGTNDKVTLNGNSSGLIVNGASATVIANGSAEIITLNGTNDALTSGAGGQTVYINGIGDTVALQGASNGVSIAGSNNVVDLGVSAASVSVNAGASNVSLTASNTSINAANGVSLNLTGSNDTIVGSNLTVYLNPGDTNITVQGDHDAIHVRSGMTPQISGSNDSVIIDTVITAHNGDTIQHYNGTNQLIDLPGLAFDSSITATPVLNPGHTAGQLVIADHGATVATINLTSIDSIGNFTVRSDGSGGTLVVDPPLGGDDEGNTIRGDNFQFNDPTFQAAASGVTGAGGRTVGIMDKGNFDFSAFDSPVGKTGMPGASFESFDHASVAPPHGSDFSASAPGNIVLELSGHALLEIPHSAAEPHLPEGLRADPPYWHLHA